MDEVGVYRVKRPSVIIELLGMIFIVGIHLFIIRSRGFYNFRENFINTSFGVIIALIGLISIVLLISRLFTSTKIFEIQIHPDYLLINDEKIEAKQIKNIYNSGYFGTLTGIRLIDQRFVRYRFCFRYLTQKDEDAGMKQLLRWAEQSGVKVSQKNFKRLL